MPTEIQSTAQWRQILSSNTIVVTDFHADWCGPCKAIAPTFESLSTRFSKPGRIAFVKVNVDTQQAIAQQYSVRAMPTFLILRSGSVIDTIQGANPPALTAAVDKAVKLAGTAAPGASFSAGGRTLGGPAAGGTSRSPGQGIRRPGVAWDLNGFLNAVIVFFGLYVSSLFSFDPYMSAQNSKYNIRNPTGPSPQASGSSGAGQRTGSAPKSSFRTLQDLGGD